MIASNLKKNVKHNNLFKKSEDRIYKRLFYIQKEFKIGPMTANSSQVKTALGKWIRPSHRTFAEQAIGFSVFLMISLTFSFSNYWFIKNFLESIKTPVLLEKYTSLLPIVANLPWIFYQVFLVFGIWALWRRFSLRVLKLEISAFLLQCIFLFTWSLSFFLLQKALLALVFLLFLVSNTVLTALLYWKKEKISGHMFTIPFLWTIYLLGVNMLICICNP